MLFSATETKMFPLLEIQFWPYFITARQLMNSPDTVNAQPTNACGVFTTVHWQIIKRLAAMLYT